MSNKESGFSLVEIMVVLVIIGTMIAIVAPRLIDRADDARVEATKTQMVNIAQTLKLYRMQNSKYPTSSEGISVLVSPSRGGKQYLDSLPNDAWGNPFVYLQPGVHGAFDLLSYGADGKLGGVGYAADIGNWKK